MRSRLASLRSALVLLASLLFVPTRAGAVNLVPNPSFENFTSISGCPTSFSNFNDAGPWFTPTLGTSDYFNACASGPFAPGVPTSILGFQPAHTGIAHAGFISNSFQNYHEYCEVQLSSPLANSVLYTVEFWINLADQCDRGIDRVGAYLSNGPITNFSSNITLPVTPQIETPQFLTFTDKINWVKVSGTIIGAGQDHITIGSFRDSVAGTETSLPGIFPYAYYYLDDVSVAPLLPVDQACCLPNGQCTIMLPGECQAQGGTPMGVGSVCSAGACTPLPVRRGTWGEIKSRYR